MRRWMHDASIAQYAQWVGVGGPMDAASQHIWQWVAAGQIAAVASSAQFMVLALPLATTGSRVTQLALLTVYPIRNSCL